MKTSIQELIRFIENDKMQSTYTKEQVLELLNFKLEKEKEQIESAYMRSLSGATERRWKDIFKKQAEQYYNETFKSE